MEKNNYLPLVIVIGVVFLIYTALLVYLIIRLNRSKETRREGAQVIAETINNPVTGYNTEFFKKSADYAEQILSGKVFIQEYGSPEFYGNRLVDTLQKLNQDTKEKIKVAIRYMMLEPVQARNNEQVFRMMSEQERVPLWYVILRDATKKMVPEYTENSQDNSGARIVPITSKVA